MLQEDGINIGDAQCSFPTPKMEAKVVYINDLNNEAVSFLLLEIPVKNSEERFSVIIISKRPPTKD